MTIEHAGAPQYSALQLAWLLELGIEKPWLPSDRLVQPVTPKPTIRTPALQTPKLEADTQLTAASAADLQALAETVAACQACGLCRERKQTVFGEGVMQPAIMVIGEAPAEHEDRQGRPFVDRMGLMLDNMLTAIQSSRTRNVYVTNIVKCRPPGNRPPRAQELAACKPYLLRQISLVQPFAILAVGKVAAQVLLETQEPLESLRQITHYLTVENLKIPLIVSHHPVQLLSHPARKASAWQDLQLVRTVSGL